MNLEKWLQLICPLILAIIPAILVLRDWKYYDKRTNVHRWITKITLIVWLVSAFGLAWATWRSFYQTEKEPAFEFYLNNVRLANGVPITLPLNNKTCEMVLAVRSTGNWTADRLTVHAVLPNIPQFMPTTGWQENPAGFEVTQTGISPRENMKHFQIESANLVEPMNFFVCPSFVLQDKTQLPITLGLSFVATAKNSKPYAVGVIVKFVAN